MPTAQLPTRWGVDRVSPDTTPAPHHHNSVPVHKTTRGPGVDNGWCETFHECYIDYIHTAGAAPFVDHRRRRAI